MATQSTKVLILTGPTAAGKNTVGGFIAEKLSHCVVIDVDLVRWMVRQPHTAAWEGDEGIAQLVLGARNACLLARSFVEAGYPVVILDFLIDETAQLYKAELNEFEPKIVLLLPSFDEIWRRNLERGRRLTDDEIEWTYDVQNRLTVFDTRIDNTYLSAEEMAGRLAVLI